MLKRLIRANDITKVRELLNSKDKPRTKTITKYFLTACDHTYNGDVYISLEIFEELLKNGADINATTYNGDTALMLVCQIRDKIYTNTVGIENYTKTLVHFFLKNGANPNFQRSDGYTLLMILCEYHSLDKLCQAYAVLSIKEKNERNEIIDLLIQYKADVNLQRRDGYTALLDASEETNLDAVRILLKNGANINIRCRCTPYYKYGKPGSGMNAIMIVSKNGNFEILKELLINGARTDIHTLEGQTAISLVDISHPNAKKITKLLENYYKIINMVKHSKKYKYDKDITKRIVDFLM
jgi:ankyrin repeat protein